MEMIRLRIGEEHFDQLVHGGLGDPVLPQASRGVGAGGEIMIAAKGGCTTDGAPGVCISFHASVDGKAVRVQAVTTLRAFLTAANTLRVHPDLQI